MIFKRREKGTEIIKEEMTFFRKNAVPCPICATEVMVEQSKTGGARISAGTLQPDLYRPYLPSEEFGDSFPLLYALGTCPTCFFSAFWNHFTLDKKTVTTLSTKAAKRHRNEALQSLFKKTPDFSEKRTLPTGLASYFLALVTYSDFIARHSPTIHRAVCAIRAAWLCNLMNKYGYGEKCTFLAKMFYRKALYFYGRAINFDSGGKEAMRNMKFLGPDTDRDYGYDGIIHLYAWLEFHYGPSDDPLKREKTMLRMRNNLSRVFGFGRSSKEKPSILLSVARETYDAINASLKKDA